MRLRCRSFDRALPRGTRVIVLGGRDIVTDEQLAATIVWADVSTPAAPGALSRSTARSRTAQCTSTLAWGGVVSSSLTPQQHGCGEWLHVDWATMRAADTGDTVTDEDIPASARAPVDDPVRKIETEHGRRVRHAAELCSEDRPRRGAGGADPRATCAIASRRSCTTRDALVIAKRHKRPRAYGWSVLAYQSPDHLGLVSLSGTVVAPRPFKAWRGKPNAGGKRRR